MRNTIIVMSSNREIETATKKTLQNLTDLGAIVLLETGSADVAFARCRALSWACEKLREYPERDVVLMLDDDMDVPAETAQALADRARETGRACSAVYSTLTARVAAARWPGHPGLWLVGLGCVAIPRALLLDLEERSESFEVNGRVYSALTWSGPEDGTWVGEDFRLSKNLGGVHLCPLAVGHIKKGALWPDEETLAQLARSAHEAAPAGRTGTAADAATPKEIREND
ncbi:MAG TPA: hypothetical protein VHP33_17515 [Polyangiaceae bacterium]|nr:hypothetical protein [Polyangiaceae bacterium]